ncbi:hypothetical protein [Micromonospora eburnea]|uniref:Uncharacterized protein n=1 Tax=Micromonospora eburnea TaxID=227316 RepID=A0A1C6UBA9_9ACTN|nr:hypothetical protein [Micromonospora eburnea]SCL51316.1 hypothetical protein GA0070604_2329 [Micromonospora eburnea]
MSRVRHTGDQRVTRAAAGQPGRTGQEQGRDELALSGAGLGTDGDTVRTALRALPRLLPG